MTVRDDESMIVDDVGDDALAAWKEVMERTPSPEPEPEPVAETGDAETVDKGAEAGKTVARDEHGRFAPKSDKPSTETDAKPDAKTDTKTDTKEDDGPKIETAHEGGPPPSWSVKAKAAWEALPAEVRADITKREGEVAQGLAALRDYKDLKPYAEMARQHNTTIAGALDRYIAADNMLKTNFPQGVMWLAQSYGMTQEQAGHLFLDMGQRMLGKTPGAANGNGAQQQQSADDDPLNELLNPFVKPLMEKISALESKLSSREQADRNAEMQSYREAFESLTSSPEFRFIDELRPHMAKLIDSGLVPYTGDVRQFYKTAYDMAARLHPEVGEALIEQRLREQREAERKREQEAADKARQASRSLSGSRLPGMEVVEPSKGGGVDDIEDDVRRAMRQLAHV